MGDIAPPATGNLDLLWNLPAFFQNDHRSLWVGFCTTDDGKKSGGTTSHNNHIDLLNGWHKAIFSQIF
jgi:hypothetical protein